MIYQELNKPINSIRRKISSNKILSSANSWVGTKFHYHGRIKKNEHNKGGVDCIGFIMKVGEEVGSKFNGRNIIDFDYLHYSRTPNQGEMEKFFNRYFTKVKKPSLGDIVYMRFDNNLEHAGLLTKNGLTHCYIEANGVAEHHIDKNWEARIVCYYRYPNN